METKVIQLPIMSVEVGSADKFRGLPEPGQHINRPLMVNAWSQTTGSDFSYLHDVENSEKLSQRERELEEKVRVLEEKLNADLELLSQIHATSARTSALLSQQKPQNQQYNNNIGYNNHRIISSNIRATQINPKSVNALNHTQQVNCAPVEYGKYTILAEGTTNNNDEPIYIHLANSGRAEENIEMTTDYNSANNSTTIQHQKAAATSHTTNHEHHVIKRKILAAQQIVTKTGKNQIIIYGNSIRKTAKVRITNVNSTLRKNVIPSPAVNSNNCCDTSIITYDPDNIMVSIGPNDTRIPAKLYNNMNWTSASIATRRLLMTIFDRKVLATHSLAGNSSRTFKNRGKPVTQMLDPKVIADIIFEVTRRCQVSEKEVRNAITTKCAYENNSMKLQINKRTRRREINKENRIG